MSHTSSKWSVNRRRFLQTSAAVAGTAIIAKNGTRQAHEKPVPGQNNKLPYLNRP
jgi:hypothetical protein